MNSDMISEKELKKAAAQVRDAMLDETMVMETEEHTFSPEFEKTMQQGLPVRQRRKAVPAMVSWPLAALLALVVGISCFLVGRKPHDPNYSDSLVSDHEQHGGTDADGMEGNSLPVSEMYTASCQFSVDGLVGSVVLTQAPESGQAIEVNGSSGNDAFGVVSMRNEGEQ